jgi:hypothetical protein
MSHRREQERNLQVSSLSLSLRRGTSRECVKFEKHEQRIKHNCAPASIE